MQKEDLRDRFIRVFGSSDLQRTTLAMDDVGKAPKLIFPIAARREHHIKIRHRSRLMVDWDSFASDAGDHGWDAEVRP